PHEISVSHRTGTGYKRTNRGRYSHMSAFQCVSEAAWVQMVKVGRGEKIGMPRSERQILKWPVTYPASTSELRIRWVSAVVAFAAVPGALATFAPDLGHVFAIPAYRFATLTPDLGHVF